MPTVILNLVFAISSLRLGTFANSAPWDWASAQVGGWRLRFQPLGTIDPLQLVVTEPVAYLTVPLTSYIDADWVLILNASITKRNFSDQTAKSCLHNTWIRWSVLIHSLPSDLAVVLRPWNSSDVLLRLRGIFTVGWKAWQNVRWLMLSCIQLATALTMTNACLTPCLATAGVKERRNRL